MTKILLILEKIKNEMLFIKKLRSITNQSFSEIKDSIKNKSPFFAEISTDQTRKKVRQK